MASLNRVLIIGNLGQDPELRYTPNQVAVATLNVATTESRPGADGQRQEVTEWHRVIVWNKQAENCAKYLAKGRTVFVEGKLQTRSWEDKTGQKRYTTEIVAQNVQFLGGAGGSQSRERGEMGVAPSNSQGSQNASGNQGSPEVSGSQPGAGGTYDPTLDDIPF
ncbi:MAG: single-stranded DNA-binding protein [Proteobacteria bacterium]|nr:single-stranded DNA-binding protein [Pseudomonadota bacterium]